MNRRVIAIVAMLAVGCASSAAPAQGLADRALWDFLEPVVEPAVVIDPAPEFLRLIKSYGPSGSSAGGNGNGTSTLEFGESEISSLGCIVGGALGMTAAMAIGGANISNLIAGGIVPAANPAALYASLFGVVFATFCAVGQAVTPIALYTYRRYFEAEEPASPLLAPEPQSPLLGGLQKSRFQTR